MSDENTPQPIPTQPEAQTPVVQSTPPTPTPEVSAQPTQTVAAPTAPEAAPVQAAQPATPPAPAFDPTPWDKQKVRVGKKFFPAFSPRLFGNPFSFEIDKVRAKKGAEAKGFQMVDKGMVLLTPGKFMGELMVEVTGGQEGDISVIKIEEVYSKVSQNGWGNIDKDIAEAEKELGQKAKAVYLWHADSKNIVIFAVV